MLFQIIQYAQLQMHTILTLWTQFPHTSRMKMYVLLSKTDLNPTGSTTWAIWIPQMCQNWSGILGQGITIWSLDDATASFQDALDLWFLRNPRAQESKKSCHQPNQLKHFVGAQANALCIYGNKFLSVQHKPRKMGCLGYSVQVHLNQ